MFYPNNFLMEVNYMEFRVYLERISQFYISE